MKRDKEQEMGDRYGRWRRWEMEEMGDGRWEMEEGRGTRGEEWQRAKVVGKSPVNRSFAPPRRQKWWANAWRISTELSAAVFRVLGLLKDTCFI